MVQKIDATSVDILFGGKKGLDKEIAAYKAALKTHEKTVGVPAPTTHPFVEIIVKQHKGAYELVLPPEPEPAEVPAPEPEPVAPEPPEVTLEDARKAAIRELAAVRYARQVRGVSYNGSEFAANPAALSAILAAIVATEGNPSEVLTWKDRRGKYVELKRADLLEILKLCRRMTQEAFDHEREVRAIIDAAKSKQALSRIDLEDGWPE